MMLVMGRRARDNSDARVTMTVQLDPVRRDIIERLVHDMSADNRTEFMRRLIEWFAEQPPALCLAIITKGRPRETLVQAIREGNFDGLVRPAAAPGQANPVPDALLGSHPRVPEPPRKGTRRTDVREPHPAA